MSSIRRHAWALVVALIGVVAGTGKANADWPMARHDARRSATADGVSNIEEPTPYWRFYAGGTLSSSALTGRDVDGDGTAELIVTTSGRASARDPATGDAFWQTDNFELDRIVGFVQLDGTGEEELVVRSSRRVFVLDADDGTVLWAEPVGEMGTIGGVRVLDVDADGVDDLLIQECGCCSVNSGNAGFAYRFAGPGASLTQPVQLWSMPPIGCGGTRPGATLQMRSAAQSEIVFAPNNDTLQLLDAATLAVIDTLPPLGPFAVASQCRPIDVAGSPNEELLCVYSLAQAPPGEGRRVVMFDWTGSGLDLVWDIAIADENGTLEIPASPVADLDQDGLLEVVLSGKLAGGDWATFVIDAGTGVLRGQLAGHRAQGTAVLGAGVRYLVTEAFEETVGWTLSGAGLSFAWSLTGEETMAMSDLPTLTRAFLGTRLVTLDVDGDGVDELVTKNEADGTVVTAFGFTTASPQPVRQYTVPPGSSALNAWRVESPSGPLLAVAQSDGNLHVLDESWAPFSGNPEVGIRVGGYYSSGGWRQLRFTPVAASLGDSGPAGLLVQTSRGSLARIDATDATFSQGPLILWERLDTIGAVIQKGSSGQEARIAAIDIDDVELHRVVGLAPSGEQLWSTPLGGATLSDLVLADVDGDPYPDLFVNWGELTNSIERNTCLAGATGAELWDAPPIGPFNRQPAGVAAADWNQDGVDDMIHQADLTRVRDGQTGLELLSGGSGPGRSYYLPHIADVDDDGEDEVTLHGGFSPAFTLEHDLQSSIWEGTEDDRPYPYGAIVRCGADPPTILGGSWQFPARLKRTVLAGPDAGLDETRVLAGGQIFADQAAADAAGATSGQLGSPTVHPNLDGNGRRVAVVGSGDGWLYGFDPCELELEFSVFFGAPVGSAIFADGDGDGLDEIIVSVADGYVYGLRQAPIASVEEVLDTDPPNGIDDEDVDVIETFDTLYGAWPAVEGADGYEVAVLRDPVDGGGFVSDGPWQFAAGTAATVEGLPLEDGRRYFFAVRALANGEASPDVLSDGVVVTIVPEVPDPEVPDPEDPDPEPGEDRGAGSVLLNGRSCVYFCAASHQTDPRSGWIAIAALSLLAARRRTRTRGC